MQQPQLQWLVFVTLLLILSSKPSFAGTVPYCVSTVATEAGHLFCSQFNNNATACGESSSCNYAVPAYNPNYPRIKDGGVYATSVEIEILIDDVDEVPTFGLQIECDAFLYGDVETNYPQYWEYYDSAEFLPRYKSNIVGSVTKIMPFVNTLDTVILPLNHVPSPAIVVLCAYEEFKNPLTGLDGTGTRPNPHLNKHQVGEPMFPFNTNPFVAKPIPNQHALPDWDFDFAIANGTLIEPDFGDVITCEPIVPRVIVWPDGTTTHYNDTLPSWLTYTDSDRRFTGRPATTDVDDFRVIMHCHDNFGAIIEPWFDFNVWGIGFLPGYPRIRPGTLDEFAFEVEVAFSDGVFSLVDSLWTCQAFLTADNIIPSFFHDESRSPPRPSTEFHAPVDDVDGPVPGTSIVLNRRIDTFDLGIRVVDLDVYCAFTPDVDWWAGPFPIMSHKFTPAAGSAGTGTQLGYAPGYPRIRTGKLTKFSALVEILFWPDTRSQQPIVACHSVPRGLVPTYDAFGVPDVLVVGKFGAPFDSENLITGRVTTGSFNIDETDIYCVYNDYDTGEWIQSDRIRPFEGFADGFPRIQEDSTTWDSTVVEIRFDNNTVSQSEFIVCHVHPDNYNVTFDEFGVPDPPSLFEYTAPFQTGDTVELLIWTGGYNMTSLEIRCEFSDSQGTWTISDTLKPHVGFFYGYPRIAGEDYGGSGGVPLQTNVLILLDFGEHTGMPWNDTITCWSFLRDDEPTFPPDTTYAATLPCLPTACTHAQPPVPIPAPIGTAYGVWDHTPGVEQGIRISTAPYSPIETQQICAYFDVDRKWVISRRTLPNNAPQLIRPVGRQTAFQDRLFSFVIPDNTFEDRDIGDTLTYQLDQRDAAGLRIPLPSWLTFDPVTRLIEGTPNFDEVGVYVLRVTVTDGPGESASDTFQLVAVDDISPTVTVQGILPDRASATGPWTALISFSEAVFGFNPSDTLTNAVIIPGTESNTSFTTFTFDFQLDPAADPLAPLGVTVGAAFAVDRADNPNIATALPLVMVRLDPPSADREAGNLLSSDPVTIIPGANNPVGGVDFQYSLDGAATFHTLTAGTFTFNGTVGGMRPADAIPLETRIDPFVVFLRCIESAVFADPYAPVSGTKFVPGVFGLQVTYDLNEVLEMPSWLPDRQRIKSNTTFTIVPPDNDPGTALGRFFQYSDDNSVWYDLPSDQLTFDGVVPGFREEHRLNQTHYETETSFYYRAVAPYHRPGIPLFREYLVNPCHAWCEVCYGFSNTECTWCRAGFFLFEGATCVTPTSCGRGQEANTAERICKDKPRVLLSITDFLEPPPTTDIGLTRFQVLDGQVQDLPITMEENVENGLLVWVSLSRTPDAESIIDVQWQEVRDELVSITEGIASSSLTLMTFFPSVLFFTARDWNIPQSFLLKPVDDSFYNGNRVVVLPITVDSASFPSTELFKLGIGINAQVTMSIREDDPMNIPIDGITSLLDRRVWIHEGVEHTLGYVLPRAPTGPITLHIVQTPVGIAGGDDGLELEMGQFSPENVTLTLNGVASANFSFDLHFNSSDWNTPHPLLLAPLDDEYFTDFERDYVRLSYSFSGVDPFYYEATVLPTDVVVSDDDAGCPFAYMCANRGTCVTPSLPAANSFDALSRPFTFGGACDCFTAFGGSTCEAATFEFVRVDFLMQVEILSTLDVDFEDGRTWSRLASVLQVCDQSVYVKSLEPVDSCNPEEQLEQAPSEAIIRARQAAGFYDADGNPVAGAIDPTVDSSEVEEEVLGPDPFGTCSVTGGTVTGADDLESASCIKIVVDLVGPNGLGNVEAAEAARTRFQRLQLQWERAGAAAATVTGLDYIAAMQFNAGQYVQEILRTPLPPPDRRWKLKHFTMLGVIVICSVAALMWASWRVYKPYMLHRREVRRLNKKFKVQEEEPDAILRPETMLSPHKDNIKDVMKNTRVHEREEMDYALDPQAARRARGEVLPEVNPFIHLDLAKEEAEAKLDLERLRSGAGKPLQLDPKREEILSKALAGSLPPSARSSPSSKGSRKDSYQLPGTPKSQASGEVVVMMESSPIPDPSSPLSASGIALSPKRRSSGRSSASVKPKYDDVGRPQVASTRIRVLDTADSPKSSRSSRGSPSSRPTPSARSTPSESPSGSVGADHAMALLSQKSRPIRPRPLKAQVRRALRINQKVSSGLMKDGVEPPIRDHNTRPGE